MINCCDVLILLFLHRVIVRLGMRPDPVLTDYLILRPTRQKICNFKTIFPASHLARTQETKSHTTKATILQEHENTLTQNRR